MVFPDDYDSMAAAITTGRATLEDFLVAHASPTPDQKRFSLKAEFSDDSGRLEYMWITDIAEGQGEFSGVLLNSSNYFPQLREGATVTVPRDAIVDWSYVENGVLVGGYTLRVMFEAVPEDERESLQQQLGYRFEAPK